MISITLESPAGRLTGFRYFWMKRVIGFDPSVHCAKCLIGSYEKAVGASMQSGVENQVIAQPGEVFYLCGVSTPYKWESNAHIAFIAEPGCECDLALYTGDVVKIEGARKIAFDGKAARSRFPGRSAAFLTCRNFQFGAAYFSEA